MSMNIVGVLRGVLHLHVASIIGTALLLVGSATLSCEVRAAAIQDQQLAKGSKLPFDVIPYVISGDEFEELSLNSLGDKVVVLEFWATWCGPCLPALDHLNQLADAVGADEIVVIAIALEAPERVRSYLARHEYPNLTFAVDEEGKLFESLSLVGIPRTVVLQRDGRVATVLGPTQVDADLIAKVRAGEIDELPFVAQKGVDIDWSPTLGADGDEVYASVIFGTTDPEAIGARMQTKPGSGKISGDGLYRSNIIQHAYGVPHTRIKSEFPPFDPDEPRYRLSVTAPGGDDELAKSMLAKAAEVKFAYDARREMVETDVLFLQRKPGVAALQESTSEKAFFEANGGGITMKRSPVDRVRQWFENMTQKPVVDQTGLLGLYDLELEWVDSDSFKRAVDEAGFVLKPGRAEIEFLVIEPHDAVEH